MNKKFIIMLYEEGASIDRKDQWVGRFGTTLSLQRMVADCNAAVEAIVSAGGEAYVCDVYNLGRDIIETELTKKAKRVSTGELKKLCQEGVDGAMLIGAHAMNSAPNAFGSYSIAEATWQKYSVNDKEYGDIGFATIFFGAYNVPIITVSGDEAAVKECQALVGDIPCAIVKKALKRNVAVATTMGKESEQMIFNACAEGVKNCKNYKPYVIPAPYFIQVEYKRADYCDEAIWCYINHGGLKRVSTLVAEKYVEQIVNYNDLRI